MSKKINVFFPYNSVGGAFRSTYEICNRLTKRGYDVVVYFPFFPFLEENRLFSLSGFKVLLRGIARSLVRRNKVLWFETHFKIKVIPLFKNLFVRDADIVIANHWPVARPVFEFDPCKGKKYFFIRDIEQWAPYYENEIKAFKLDMKRLVVAEWIKDFLSENFNLGVDGVITNGFNFEKFDIGDKEFSKDRCTISMIYSTLPVKAMDDGFKVLESVKKKNPSVKILLFGFEAKPKDVPFSFEYIRGAAGEEVRDIYKRTDIFFCPSHQEGFHNPPSEAMAGKCAVLATSVGSVPFTMKNMINGLVSEPKDINDMINKMNMLVENRELRIQLSVEANKTIKNLKWDDSIDKLINILES